LPLGRGAAEVFATVDADAGFDEFEAICTGLLFTLVAAGFAGSRTAVLADDFALTDLCTGNWLNSKLSDFEPLFSSLLAASRTLMPADVLAVDAELDGSLEAIAAGFASRTIVP
jgi:hypothetical protein